MSFTLDAAQELGIPEILFWTTSACGFMGYLHYHHLVKKGLTPFKGSIMKLFDSFACFMEMKQLVKFNIYIIFVCFNLQMRAT